LETLEDRRVLASITGTVFSDADADGVQDASELGMPGVVVHVDINNDEIFDAGDPFTAKVADDLSRRRPIAGTLTHTQTFKKGVDGITLLPNPAKVAISPDGSLIAVTSYFNNNDVQLFDRDVAIGLVSVGQAAIDLPNLSWVLDGVEFSPDGKNLYVADTNA
jgi:DNA-binding beta-propeller fold protein YncE